LILIKQMNITYICRAIFYLKNIDCHFKKEGLYVLLLWELKLSAKIVLESLRINKLVRKFSGQ